MPDQPTYRPVHKALHRPLTVCGVDRRLFFLALLMGAATFNLFYSFWAGVLVFSGLYGFALWATSRDPGHAADRPRIVRERVAGTTLGSTSDSTWRWCRGEDLADPPRLQRGRRRQHAALAVGLCRRAAFLTKAGHVGARVQASRRRCGRSDAGASAGLSRTAWRPPFGSWTSGAACIST